MSKKPNGEQDIGVEEDSSGALSSQQCVEKGKGHDQQGVLQEQGQKKQDQTQQDQTQNDQEQQQQQAQEKQDRSGQQQQSQTQHSQEQNDQGQQKKDQNIQEQNQEQKGEGGQTQQENSQSTEFVEGLKVLARHGAGCNWYPGSITAVNADGTYALLYDDGDIETDRARYQIKMEGESERNFLEVGETVDARYNRDAKAYPGKISGLDPKRNLYNVLYADGDSDLMLERKYIFGLCEKSAAQAGETPDSTFQAPDSPQTMHTETTAIESLEEVELDLDME
jgi:flagellar biosynthesis GTPase FlhF